MKCRRHDRTRTPHGPRNSINEVSELRREAQERLAAAVEQARNDTEREWTAKLEHETAALRTSAAEQLRQAQADAEQTWAARLERETTTLRASADEHLAEELRKARSEAEREHGRGSSNGDEHARERGAASGRGTAKARAETQRDGRQARQASAWTPKRRQVVRSLGRAEQWAAKLEQETNTLRTSAEQRLGEDVQKARAETQQEWAAKLEHETNTLRSSAEKRLSEEPQKARAETQQEWAAKLERRVAGRPRARPNARRPSQSRAPRNTRRSSRSSVAVCRRRPQDMETDRQRLHAEMAALSQRFGSLADDRDERARPSRAR